MTKTPHRLILLATALIGSLHATPPVMGGEKILHRAATGVADIEKNQPMAADSVFWIVSMTKPITATAVMMMQDEGKLSVDDPVKHRIYLMMIQRADLANGNACDIRRDFQNAATNP